MNTQNLCSTLMKPFYAILNINPSWYLKHAAINTCITLILILGTLSHFITPNTGAGLAFLCIPLALPFFSWSLTIPLSQYAYKTGIKLLNKFNLTPKYHQILSHLTAIGSVHAGITLPIIISAILLITCIALLQLSNTHFLTQSFAFLTKSQDIANLIQFTNPDISVIIITLLQFVFIYASLWIIIAIITLITISISSRKTPNTYAPALFMLYPILLSLSSWICPIIAISIIILSLFNSPES